MQEKTPPGIFIGGLAYPYMAAGLWELPPAGRNEGGI